MDPLALFPLDEECLCELLFDIEEDRVEELVVEDDPVEAREVGPEGGIELLPLIYSNTSDSNSRVVVDFCKDSKGGGSKSTDQPKAEDYPSKI